MVDWAEIYLMIWSQLQESKSQIFHLILTAAIANPWMFAVVGAAVVIGGRRALWRLARFVLAPALHRVFDD